MALSFIGCVLSSPYPYSLPYHDRPATPSPYRKPISLISHSDVRYRGILAGIDPAASTIQLSNGMNPIYSLKGLTDTPKI
jgi:hypothetical protein